MTSWPDRRAVRTTALFLVCLTAMRAEDTFFAKRIAPVLEQKCVACHGEKKQKGKLRLDSFAHLIRGGESGAVLKPGDLKGSELFRRITLPHDDDEFMPSDGKPPLQPDEVKVLELWIAAGASEKILLSGIAGAPALAAPKLPPPPLAPDWRPRAAQIARLEADLGLRLAPRSSVATDGLILRTASAPLRCDDAALARLAPVADLIVEAELARTQITDAGLAALVGFNNLRALDLTRTSVTSAGLATLTRLKKIESLNLTSTKVEAAVVTRLRAQPTLKKLWTFDTPADHPGTAATDAAESLAVPPN